MTEFLQQPPVDPAVPDAPALGSGMPVPAHAGRVGLRIGLGRLLARLGRRLAGETDVPAGEIDRLRAEAAATLAASAEKSRFVALASHELRTPLNGILGLSELLGRTALTPEQANYVNGIASSGAALLTLVDDLLDVGRVEAGKLDSRPAPVDLESLIEEVVELLAPRAQAKGLELAAHVGAQVPRTIVADARLLARILLNLTGNAIKFTQSGGVAVEVTAQRMGNGTATITLKVRDTGIGIAAADLARIFGEYEQVVAGQPDPIATSTGTGLGLAISRSIARAIGGDITVDSEQGLGSTFRFKAVFPVADTADSASPRLPLAGCRVLVVSDGQVEPPLLMRRLYDLGATVDLAPDSEAAGAALAVGQRFDVMMIDHRRDHPATSVALLGATDGPTALPPAVVMLAPGERDDLPGLRKAGFAAHLVKPIRTASLTKILGALVATGGLSKQAIEPVGATDAPPASDPVSALSLDRTTALDILLADDHDINALLGRSQLASLGHAVTRASNGLEAVQLATGRMRAGRPFDVIMMDLHMPLLDGFAAIAAIRQREEGGHRSLILALSADTTETAERLALARGADGVLVKPVDSASLARLLTQYQHREPAKTVSPSDGRRAAN